MPPSFDQRNRNAAAQYGRRASFAADGLMEGFRQSAVFGRSAAVALLLGLGAAPALAADGQPSAEEMRQRLDVRRSELEATKERAKFIQSDLATLKQERERLNANLLETAGLIQKSEARLTGIEAKLGQMEAQEASMRAGLAAKHDKIAKLMAALQRMGRNPPPVLFTQRQDALQMVRSAMLLAYAFPELRGDALGLATKLNELIAVVTSIRDERDAAKTETARLADARVRLSALIETKKQTASERQAELEKVRAEATEISKNLTDLNELIGKLDQVVTRGTGLGAYNAEVAAQASTHQSSVNQAQAAGASSPVLKPSADATGLPAPAAAGDTTPTGKPVEVALNAPRPAVTVRPSIVELKPASMAVGGGNLDRFKPEIPFHLARARLPMPAQGRHVISFGDKTQYGGQSKGIVIETRHGAQITSPCDGWIVYAGEFRSYGQLLIINAGDGYHVLLAGLSQIDAQPGQFVLAAEPVGTMSGPITPASTTGSPAKLQTNAPVLYVEFRKDGRPIDPGPWWVEGHQKVQG